MRGAYNLTKEEKEKYIPYIRDCIKNMRDDEPISLNDTSLNPQNMIDIFSELGYDEVDFDSNGWEYDFWYTFVKEGEKNIILAGCGITFDLQMYFDDNN